MNKRHDRPEEGIPSIVILFSSGKNFLNALVTLSVKKCVLGKEKKYSMISGRTWYLI